MLQPSNGLLEAWKQHLKWRVVSKTTGFSILQFWKHPIQRWGSQPILSLFLFESKLSMSSRTCTAWLWCKSVLAFFFLLYTRLPIFRLGQNHWPNWIQIGSKGICLVFENGCCAHGFCNPKPPPVKAPRARTLPHDDRWNAATLEDSEARPQCLGAIHHPSFEHEIETWQNNYIINW